MPKQKPKLIIVAGPNGSGKTTITEQGLAHQWFDDCLYINPDNLAQEKFEGWNDKGSVLNAAKLATKMRYQALEEGRSIAFETVFSSDEKIDFIVKAKELGYFVRVFFISTNSPKICASRIAQRVLQGGHEVPISKIVSRYSKSIVNAYKAINLSDRLYIYDNSVEDANPKLLARYSDGLIVKQYEEKLPEWGASLIKD